jgi:hypothetical protein
MTSAHDARALARFFAGVAWGINAVNRTVADREMLRNMVRVAMTIGEMAGTVRFNHHPRIINNAQRFNEKESRCPDAFCAASKKQYSHGGALLR